LIVIQHGQYLQFKNEDENTHFIESVDLEEKPDSFFVTGQIKSGQSITISLKNLKKMIPYRCRTHPEERGVILMSDKEEKDLTNTERLRLITKTKGPEQEFWNIIKRINIDSE
jgi:hypothetical protein